MAALVWRVSKHNKSMNIADFMDTAFVIEFDGPGTFIAYQRDKQFNCKQYIKDYRDAVLWCQEQADRMEQEAIAAGEVADDEPPLDPAYEQALTTVNAFIAKNNLGAMGAVSKAALAANMAEMVFEAHRAGMEEAHAMCEDLALRYDANGDVEDASGVRSAKLWLERRIRVMKGEDLEEIERDLEGA